MPSTEETSTDQRLAEDTIYIYQRMQTHMLIATVGWVTPISVLQDRRIPSWQALKSLQWQITRCLDFISKTNRRERSVEVKIRSLLHLCTHEVYVIGHSLHHFKEEFKPQFARNILSVFHLPINAAHSDLMNSDILGPFTVPSFLTVQPSSCPHRLKAGTPCVLSSHYYTYNFTTLLGICIKFTCTISGRRRQQKLI